MATVKEVLEAIDAQVDYKKARFVKNIAEKLQYKNDAPFFTFIDHIVNEGALMSWASYPGSWNSTANHKSALSALATIHNAKCVFEVIGDVRARALKEAVVKAQKWLKDNEDDFANTRFKGKNKEAKVVVVEKVDNENVDDCEDDAMSDIQGEEINLAELMSTVKPIKDVVTEVTLKSPCSEKEEHTKSDNSLRVIVDEQRKRIELQDYIIDKLLYFINDELRGPALITELVKKILAS